MKIHSGSVPRQLRRTGGAEVSDFKYYQGHALPFIIVNAIKEQQKQIEGLKAENSALKNRIEILENK